MRGVAGTLYWDDRREYKAYDGSEAGSDKQVDPEVSELLGAKVARLDSCGWKISCCNCRYYAWPLWHSADPWH
jgi:hypothetical protein